MANKNQAPKKDYLSVTSNSWANNPKLLQVLNQIDFSNIKGLVKEEKSSYQEIAKEGLALIEDYRFDPSLSKDDTYFSNLFSVLSDTTLTLSLIHI